MTDRSDHRDSASSNNRTAWRQRLAKAWSSAQFFIAVALTGGFAVYLFLFPHGIGRHTEEPDRPKPIEAVQATGPRTIQIHSGTGLDNKIEFATVREASIASPLLTVTGTVAASLRPGGNGASDSWQFNSPETLTAFADWQKSVADIAFAEMQLKQIQDLADTRVASQQRVVDQLQKLVQSGTETLKNLAAETTILVQHQIQGKKEVYEAETAVRIARRQEGTLARQLQQSGLEPTLLTAATSDVDIVVADVPEAYLSRVKVGQQCRARFLSIAHQDFAGKVQTILPVLSRERRTLRLLFFIDDFQDQLRPGMFAEIGVGTEPREGLLAPAEGVLHVGRADYVLVGAGVEGSWRVAEVQIGEPQNGQVEILGGLSGGDRVIGKGAILLKPAVVRSLQTEASADSSLPRLSQAESR